MIASVKGVVDSFFPPYVIVDVSGVGYKVLVPHGVLTSFHIGGEIKLHTYTHVREDALDLFGFQHQLDLQLFEKLLGVSGIGPKTAMAIFSFGTRDEIISAIVKADVLFFSSVPRLGKKNAQKIIIELKEKLGSLEELDLSSTKESTDVIEALKSFGFTTQEAQKAMRELKGKGETAEEKIKSALKYLAK